MLGANLAFMTRGAGFEWRTAERASFFGAGEYVAMSDASKTWTAKGGVLGF